MKKIKRKYLSSTAVASLVLLLVASILVPSTTTAQAQEKRIQVTEGQSVVFGFIKPFTNVLDKEKRKEVGIHGGLLGSLMNRSVILTFRDVKANTASKTEIKEDFEKKRAMFWVLLPKGVYSLTSKHAYEIAADQAFAVPGNGEAIYIGDISLWHSDVSRVDWLNCDYKKESISHFISQYPQFANNVVQMSTLCGDMPLPDSKLIGTWAGIEEKNHNETISFGVDGGITIENVTKNTVITIFGTYRYLGDSRIKISHSSMKKIDQDNIYFSQLPAVVGPHVVTVELTDDALTLKLNDGSIEKYRRKK